MKQFLDFDWQSLQIAGEGHSFLDAPRLSLRSKQEAEEFLKSYGYDVGDPGSREEIWKLYFESIAFIRDHLLDPGEKMPPEFLSRGASSDVLRLLLLASGAGDPMSRGASRVSVAGKWACAILRVMHIISHLDNDVRLEHFNHARKQIFERFDPYIFVLPGRRWRFGNGADAVPLIRFIKKERKERASILIKLLSKPHTVVEEIYDRIGFRFVVENRFDAFRLVQALFRSGVVSVPNIQPGRSTNGLLPVEHLRSVIESLKLEIGKQSGPAATRLIKRRLERLEEETVIPLSQTSRNPNSSRWYRALQFTCRQLITAPDPTFVFWKQVSKELERNPQGRKIKSSIPVTLRETRTFYYPFEIQILDRASYVESIGGRSRHREYKAKQRLMARNRVLRDLI